MSRSSDCAAVLMVDGQATPISHDLFKYLKLEAGRRNVSMVDVYREELKAEQELKKTVLPRDRLEKAAQRDYSNHPWLKGEEEKPF